MCILYGLGFESLTGVRAVSLLGLLFIDLLARNFQSDHSRLRVASGHENIRIKVLYWCSIVDGSTDINTVLIYMVAQNVVSPSQHGL